MVYQLSYDLRSADKDYSDLFSFLEKGLGDGGINVLKDTWWIRFSSQPNLSAVVNDVKCYMDKTDIFCISKISDGDYNGWMPQKSWEWIKDYIN